jgi:FtsZ-binding cell division protein ZapB
MRQLLESEIEALDHLQLEYAELQEKANAIASQTSRNF